MDTNSKLLLTWVIVLPIIFMYGFVDIEFLLTNTIFISLLSWFTIGAIVFVVRLWKKE